MSLGVFLSQILYEKVFGIEKKNHVPFSLYIRFLFMIKLVRL